MLTCAAAGGASEMLPGRGWWSGGNPWYGAVFFLLIVAWYSNPDEGSGPARGRGTRLA